MDRLAPPRSLALRHATTPTRIAGLVLVALRARRWWPIIAIGSMIGAAQVAADAAPGPEAFTCLIEPKMVLKLGTAVPGLISKVLVDRGDAVKKGEVVAELDFGVEAAAVALAKARAADDATIQSARAKLDFQQHKAQRDMQLRKDQTIAISTAEEATTAAEVADAELHEAEINQQLAQLELVRAQELLKQRTIRSPVDGVVVERKLGPGEYVFDQAHILTVAQINPLNVEVFVPLREFGKIHPGMSAEVYPEEPIGGKYIATVTVVDQVFDAASGTIGIRLDLPNPDYALPSGLKCKINFSGTG